jgi:hypothetical protein
LWAVRGSAGEHKVRPYALTRVARDALR